jgi:hypothetical protein
MDCPNCGRRLPDTLVCKHCGLSVPLRPPLWRRLLDRLRAPRDDASVDTARDAARPDEEPAGIEMPAGKRAVTMSVSRVSTTRQEGMPLKNLPEDTIDALRRAAASGGAVYYERVVSDDGSGPVVSERGTPPDPQLQGAIDELLKAEAGATEEQIVVDVNGERQVYGSVDEMPPEVRTMFQHFADMPVTPAPADD